MFLIYVIKIFQDFRAQFKLFMPVGPLGDCLLILNKDHVLSSKRISIHVNPRSCLHQLRNSLTNPFAQNTKDRKKNQ